LRLRQIYDDRDFNFGRYRQPASLRSMAANGPLVDHIDRISDRQWSMIEMLVADHDALLAAKAKGGNADV
jgi:hypothetical protein